MRICSIEGCTNPVIARGWCDTHYCRWKRHGNPHFRKKAGNGELLAFIEEVVLPFAGEGCLTWPFCCVKSREGRAYARARIGGRDTLVSRYVCEKVHGPAPSPEHEAAHSCGKGHEACVAPGHIFWKTPSANQADRIIHNTHDRGERSANAKLTEADVRSIRQNVGRETHAKLAVRFGVSRPTISVILARKSWGWLS